MDARIVIMGLGSIGSKHVDALLSLGYQDLVAIDPRPMPEETRLPVLSHVDDLREWKPTHVLVCTPPEWHYRNTVWGLYSGAHVFIEKPMTEQVDSAQTLIDMAHRRKLVLAVGYQERAHPVVQQAKAWVAAHRPVHGTVVCNWHATEKTYPLDVLAESSHAIDTALYLFGRPDSIKRFKTKTSATCLFRWKDGREVTVAMNMRSPVAERIIRLYGNGEELRLGYGRTKEEWDACYKAELQIFMGGTPLCTGNDGLAVMEVLEQLH